MAVQPGIDRAFSDMALDRKFTGSAQAYHGVFVTEDTLEQQCFDNLHLIVLGLLRQSLESVLRYTRLDIDSPDSNGRTALLWAAWRGDTESVRLLLEYGADVNKTDHESFTPLAKAAQAGHLATVRSLLQANASMHMATSQGWQPIHLASDSTTNAQEMVEELLAWGADPNAHGHGSDTPLHKAAKRGSTGTIASLLAHGATIDAICKNGTAAMVALYCWNEAAFLHLARAGARLDIVNDHGHNIAQLATWSASSQSWDLITEYAEKGTLDFIAMESCHDGHGIGHCFEVCRKLWFIGEKEDERTERAAFDRMVRACGGNR
jgi:ankyrin repeat protein